MASFAIPAHIGLASQLQNSMQGYGGADLPSQGGFGGGMGPSAQGPTGAFNVPNNLFGQQGFMPTGFAGYNANNANTGWQPPTYSNAGPGSTMPSFANMGFTPYGIQQMQQAWQSDTLPGQSNFNPATMVATPQSTGAVQGNPFSQMMTGSGYGGNPPGSYGPGNSYFGGGNGFNPSTLSPSSILQQVASGQGYGAAVNTLPAWQSAVGAEQYNIQQGADNLAEQFNAGGGLFSNAYGSAQGQYQEQARLGQNAQLSQSTLQSLLQAQGVQAGAGSQFSSQGYGAASQESSQGMQSQLALLQALLGTNNTGIQSATGLGNLYSSNLNNAGNVATTYPQQQYNPGWLTQLLGGLGGAAGGVGSLIGNLPTGGGSTLPPGGMYGGNGL